jgi:DNA-binding transcriptional regulator YiaG
MPKQPRHIDIPCPHCGQPYTVINGLYLRERREAAGLTQREFAKIIDASGPYISDIERNRRRCPDDVYAVYLHLRHREKP